MVQWFGALAVLTENLDLVPSAHIRLGRFTICDSSSKGITQIWYNRVKETHTHENKQAIIKISTNKK